MREKYRTIVADPPWSQGDYPSHLGGRLVLGRGNLVRPELPYEPMTLQAIADLPVADLSEDDARLFLWTTNRFLPDAFGIVAAWGFKYRQTLVWHKTVNGTPFVASVAPNHAEYLLVAVRGQPERRTALASSVIGVPSRCGGGGRRHSAKPDVFIDLIEQVSPAPYVELFARRARFGWDYWGDESLGTANLVEADA